MLQFASACALERLVVAWSIIIVFCTWSQTSLSIFLFIEVPHA